MRLPFHAFPRLCASWLLALLPGCQGLTLPADPPAKAQQVMHQGGVPHTDRLGRLRHSYDPTQSFFPIGIYHAMQGEAFGKHHDLGDFAAAGFNTVHLWPVQDIDAALNAAERLGLQVIVQHPDETLARRRHGSPALLAWMLEDEPSQFISAAQLPARLAAFDEQAARFKSFDPGRATLLVDGPGIAPNHYWRWRSWLPKADIAAQFNYPFARSFDPVLDIERVALSVSRAVRLTGGTKPIWYIAQSFADPVRGWYMPTSEQLRALVFTALVHGASGVIHFSYDSHGTRDGDVLGISPAPLADHGNVPDYDNSKRSALKVDAAQLAASRALWQSVADLNRELAALAPSLLQPTAAFTCRVETAGNHRRSQPIRLLAKPADTGDLLLIAVNIEAVALQAGITCDADIVALSPYSPAALPAMRLETPRRFHDEMPPFGVRLYRVRLK